MMAVGKTAKKPAQVLLSACESVQMGRADLLGAECSSRQLGHRWGIKHGRAPAARPAQSSQGGWNTKQVASWEH